MGARHLVLAAAMALAVGAVENPAAAQDDQRWRAHFTAGEEARQAGNHAKYADEMAAAADALPAGALNRPSVQYQAARASALAARTSDAVTWLARAWEERIEPLMISFAEHDPAFASMKDDPGFLEVMGRAETMELGVRHLGGSVHLITGAGANVVAHVSGEGAFLVDTGYRPAIWALRGVLAELGNDDVSHLLVTHAHEDHMGSAAELGGDAVVFAHPGTASAMAQPYNFMQGVDLPPKGPGASPDVLISRDTTLVIGGEVVRMMPTVAHTAGDVSVYFTESKVAHLGDAFLTGNEMMFPGQLDPDGFLDALEAFVDDMDPATVVVPGHADVADVETVRAQIATTRACMAFVRAALEDGKGIEQTAIEGMERFPPQWIAFFYGLFSRG
ncbi:MAG: MBL fold metallo-hydrolase [Gemmatimonadota bacterium]